jgi:hypothetical protein
MKKMLKEMLKDHRMNSRFSISLQLLLAFSLFSTGLNAVAVSLITPGSDDDILEVLPGITQTRPARENTALATASARKKSTPTAAALQARQDITIARQTGDTRYWGRAQAVLGAWWDKPDAPTELAVLQATVQQGRHEFDAARKTLTAALARAPGSAQGWLNLAALERLSGRYPDALKACDAVGLAGQGLHAQACRLETESLQGRQSEAATGLQVLIDRSSDSGQRSWLLGLLAESEERAGRLPAAGRAFENSLALESDLYTSIALSDFLLRSGSNQKALAALNKAPETDAVLLRRATAYKRMGDARWKAIRGQLTERVAELVRRGDDPYLHGRELALTALWLDDDAVSALKIATKNLQLQKEPIDWWIALASAAQAKDGAAQSALSAQLRATGLKDNRITGLLSKAAS